MRISLRTGLAAFAAAGLLVAVPIMAETLPMHPWVSPSCMQAAIQARDTTMISNYDTYHQAITDAIHVRMDAEVAAWNLTDIQLRQQTVRSAEQALTLSYNSASHHMIDANHAARAQFNVAVRACSQQTHPSSSSSSVSSSQQSVACQDFSNTVSGTFTVPLSVPDVGRTYLLTGSATMGDNTVKVQGYIHGTGFIAQGTAIGAINFKNGDNTMMLNLTGPTQPGFSALPTTFKFSVMGAKGQFAGMSTHGTADLKIDDGSAGSFTLTFHSNCGE